MRDGGGGGGEGVEGKTFGEGAKVTSFKARGDAGGLPGERVIFRNVRRAIKSPFTELEFLCSVPISRIVDEGQVLC